MEKQVASERKSGLTGRNPLAKERMHSKIPRLEQALLGSVGAHQRFLDTISDAHRLP